MTSPYDWLAFPVQVALAILLTIAALLWGGKVSSQGALIVQRVPGGIAAIEMPWSAGKAEDNLARLRADGRDVLRDNLKLDFLFLLLYPLAISLACATMAQLVSDKYRAIGFACAWAVLAAMPLDAIENTSLLAMLSGRVAAPWPQLSTFCATFKFAVTLGGLFYFIVALVHQSVICIRQMF